MNDVTTISATSEETVINNAPTPQEVKQGGVLFDQMKQILHLIDEQMPESPIHLKIYHCINEVLRIPANRPPGVAAIDCMFIFYMHLFRYYFPLVNKDEKLANATDPLAYCSLITNYIDNLSSNKSRRLCMHSVRSFPDILTELLSLRSGLDIKTRMKILHHVSVIAENIKRHTHPKVVVSNVPYLNWLASFFLEQFQNQDIEALTSDTTLLSVVDQIEKREKIITV